VKKWNGTEMIIMAEIVEIEPVFVDKKKKEKKEKLTPRIVAEMIMIDEGKGETKVKYYHGDFFIYEIGKGYNILDPKWIEQETQKVVNSIRHEYEGDISNNFVKEVVGHVSRTNYVLDNDIKPNLMGINNGILDVEHLKIIEPTPDLFVPLRIPVTYKKDADCLLFKKFLHEVTHSEEDYKCIQEYLGYTLWNDFPIHCFLVLQGGGRNGKSTLLDLVIKFIGESNKSTLSPQELENDKYASVELNNKLANIDDDIPHTKLRYTGILKKASSGSTLRGQKKYGQPFDFVSNAKLWFSANKLPVVEDDSDAFWQRVMLIKFTNQFGVNKTDKEPDLNLYSKLITPEEMSGILNFALEGLSRLRKNRVFTYNKTTNNNKNPRIYGVEICGFRS